MALLLPQCAPPESLHHQLTVRQRLSLRRSRKPARATHGAAESSSSGSNSTKKAATDRYRIPGAEPCCNITSPLLMTPRISVRRSSRLRVRKGRWDDAKTDTDMDSAEWINRMLDKNGVVEVDPVTIAKQMQQEQLYQINSPSTNSHYHAANYVSSADSSHINPPRSSGFPPKVPLAVALAAGSAVALAAIAFLLKSLNKQGDETASTSSDSEGSNLSSSFKGDPVAPDSSSKGSHSPPQGTRGNKEALASTAAAAAAGAAILQPGNVKERSSTPSPPSLSKTGTQGEKSQSPSKYASVTPFFTSNRSSVSDSKPAPPVSRWGEEKFKSVQPFFADDRAAVAPSIPEEQSTTKKSEISPSPSKTVTPFFTPARSSVSDSKPAPPVSRWGEEKFKAVQPFFADEQQGSTKKSEKSPSPSKTVTPLKSEKSPSPSKTVTPFFTSAKSSVSDSKPAPPVSRWGEDKFKAIQPFFADDRAAVAPIIPEEQSSAKKSEKSPSPSKAVTPLKSEKSPSSPSKTVTPFFTSARSSVSDSKPAPPVSRWGEDKFKAIQPFFADDRAAVAPIIPEEQSSAKKSEKSPSPSKTVTPLKSEKSPSSPSKTVTPFFTSARSSVSDSKPAPPVSRWGEDKFKAIQPFFADDRAAVAPIIPEEQSSAKKSEKSPSPSKTVTPLKSEKSPSSPSKTVTPFFTSARSSVSDSKPAPPVSRWGEDKFKAIQPFFADDRAAVAPIIPEEQSSAKKSEKSPSPSKTVTPLKSEKSPSSPSKTVTPFFTSARSSVSDSKPAPPVSRWGEDKFKAIQPFFADDRAAVAPIIPEEQSTTTKSEKSPSPSKTVTPFFTSAKSSVSDLKPAPPVSRWGEDKFKAIQPFFADDRAAVAPSIPEEQSTPSKSESSPSPSKTVNPFFADEQQGSKDAKESVSVESVPPFFAVNEKQSSNRPSVKTVTPFFADEQQQTNGSSSLENVIPFFADEQQQGRSVSQSKDTLDLENVKPFFSDDQVERQSLAASIESLKPTRITEGKEMLAEMAAAKPQDQHKEFRDDFSFQGDEVSRSLNPEEFAVLEDIKAEEERRQAKMQALQAAFPALAIGAGAVGALAGVDGALEMVGVTATASFISYELLWANKRNELLDEISRISDHHQLFRFLQKRKVLKDDC